MEDKSANVRLTKVNLQQGISTSFHPVYACQGRMEDKSSNVRKAAMQLLMTLLHFNPFGPVLEEPRLAATLDAHAAKLQVQLWLGVDVG